MPADDPGSLTFEVGGTSEVGYVTDLVPEVAEQLAWGALKSREAVEDELDMMFRATRGFWEMEPDQVLRMISALSARATEMCVHLHRLEARREWRQIRTRQAEQLLAEFDRQFKLHSRLIEVRRQDIEISR